jgi:uncharacterized protein DUF2252
VAGQHLMQAESDIFLGWTRVPSPDGVDRDFYVRQLKDWKFSAPIEQAIPSGMTVYARLCEWTLARAHARSGDRIALAAYLGGSDTFDQAIADFAETYADQNERDYAALKTAKRKATATAWSCSHRSCWSSSAASTPSRASPRSPTRTCSSPTPTTCSAT